MTGNELPGPYDYPFAGECEAHCPWCGACLDDMPVRLGDLGVSLDCDDPDRPEARLRLTGACPACGRPVAVCEHHWFDRRDGMDHWCGSVSAERTETDRAYLRRAAGMCAPQGQGP